MSFYEVENTAEDVEVLEGATIHKVWLYPDRLVLEVEYAPDLEVNGHKRGTYQVWADAEGNGPGYLALVGHAQV